MQVDFYQLSRDPVERVLPSIAQRVLGGGGRLLVVADAARLERISAGLWNAAPESFLAHGRADGDRPEAQPILLSAACEAPNGARNIAIADGLWREEGLGFDRVFYFFDDESIGGARGSWRALSRREGVEPRFWRQDGRRWVQGP